MFLKVIRNIAIFPIKFYRNCISPFKLRCCRFHPSCSEYACLAVEKHGIIKGFFMAAWRVIRCNPFSPGGYDPV